MPRWFVFMFFFVFLALTNTHAQTAIDATSQLQATLPNGMQVVVQSAPWEHLTRVEVFYSAGSATDPDSLYGIAHLAEHLLTSSSKNYPDGELHRLQTLYTTYANAYTGASSMCFVNRCLPEFLPQVLGLEVERMHGTVIDSISFEREILVVQEELAYRTRLSAYQEFLISIFQVAYPGHPFARDVGGSIESVGRIKYDDFLYFQETHIKPSRAVLVITGPVDAQETLDLVRELFNFGLSLEPVSPVYPDYPEVEANQVIGDANDHTGLKVGIACRIPLQDSRDAVLAFSLLDFLDESWLGLNLWSVPGEAVFMAHSSGSYYRPPTDPEQHYGMLYPEFDPEQDAQRRLGNIWEELEETLTDLSHTKAFNKARRRAMDRVGKQNQVSYSGSGTGEALVNGNDYLDNETTFRILKNLQPKDLQQFAQRYLHPGRAFVGVSHGSDSARSARIKMARRVAPQSDPGASEGPQLLTADLIQPVLDVYRTANLFRFEKTNLPNGIPVHSVVLPDADGWFFGGCQTYPLLKEFRQSKKAGLNHLYNWVVDYDYSQNNNLDRDEGPQRLPFNISTYLAAEELSYRLDCSPTEASQAASIMYQRLIKDEFNTSRWGYIMRFVNVRLSRISNSKRNAATAWRWGKILGDDHPALSSWQPNLKKASSIKYRDLEKLHSKVAGEIGNTTLVCAGPLNYLELEKAFRGKFWPKKKWEPNPDFTSTSGRQVGEIGKVFPDLTKGDVKLSVSFGPVSIQQSNPRWGTLALLLREAVYQSLMTQLRERDSLTYTASCSVLPYGNMMMLDLHVSCHSGQAHIVLSRIKEILAHHAVEGFTVDELARARLSLTCDAVESFGNAEGARDMLLQLASFGRVSVDPMAMIFAIKNKQINNTAYEFFSNDNFVFTVIGPMFEEDLDQFTFEEY